jgi:hypothetical protein
VGNRNGRVRRFLDHSDRLIALPDNGWLSRERLGDYDPYMRRAEPGPPKQPGLPVLPAPRVERRVCPACGRSIRYNLRRDYYYSHTVSTDSAQTCPQSGRPALPEPS